MSPYQFKSGMGGLSNPMTQPGQIIYSGTSGAPLALTGSTATSVLTSNGPTAAPSWQMPSAPLLTVRSVTTTDSPTVDDDVLVCSGSSFTITLPSLSGLTGKQYTIIHNGTFAGSRIYTLATTGGATVGGFASTVVKLFTTNERFVLIGDEANNNWIIAEHEAVTTFTTYTPIFTSFGSCTNITFYSRRNGELLEGWGFFRVGTVAASEAKFSIGLGISNIVTQVDTGRIAQYTVVGTAGLGAGSVVSATMWGNDVGAISFANLSGSGTGNTAANASAITSNTVNASVTFRVPIASWMP